MGTGGTLPSSIVQQVSLFNTTGLIEKDKGIYFCPFLSKTAKTISTLWLIAFNTVVSSTTTNDYKDITISNWSPRDRSLVIKGVPDDFRCITERGKSLNYLILSRSLTINNSTRVFEDAFFITAVEQVGNGSVRITLEPDDFTNIFYLHNEKLGSEYSGSYPDVFNERLKNCYVARQHYDRVEKLLEQKTLTVDDGQWMITQTNYDQWHICYIFHDYDIQEVVVDSLMIFNTEYRNDITDVEIIREGSEIDITLRTTDFEELDEADIDSITFSLKYYAGRYKETNLHIFSQIEESFKYKRQYRDYKEFINYGEPLTEAEKTAYEEASSWSELTNELKIKALKLSTAFLHFTMKDDKVLIRNGSGSADVFTGVQNTYPNVKDVEDYLITLVTPVCNMPNYLRKFYQSIYNIFENISYYYRYQDDSDRYLITGIKQPDVNDWLSSKSVMSQYILSSYISKESSLIKNMVFTPSSISIDLEGSPEYEADIDMNPINALFRVGLEFSPNLQSQSAQAEVIAKIIGREAYYTETPDSVSETWIFSKHGLPTGYDISILILESQRPINFTLNLDNSIVNKNLKTEFFDTVLTFNPYSFYSISYLGRIESPLNKLNYYENPVIDCELTVHVTDIMKYNFIPTYNIRGLKQKMYSEGIEQTITSHLTLITTELSSFIIANQAQMRNQYAVNDLNHEYGLITGGVGGVGNIAGGAGKGALVGGATLAGAGAIAGAVQTVTGFINEFIEWDRDTKLINMNQKAKLADLGNTPSNLKQLGTDITVDLNNNELGLYLNHYTIDEVSYNSICKYLERFGYAVNVYDELHVNTRKGWDYIQLISFDYNDNITVEQEENIRQILLKGVTLLHNKSYMTSGHNYEIILD